LFRLLWRGADKVNGKRDFIRDLVEEFSWPDTEVTPPDLEIRPNDEKIAVNLIVGRLAQFARKVDNIGLRDDFLAYLVERESSRHLHLRRVGAFLRDAANFCDFEANLGIGPGVEPIFAEKVHPHYWIGDDKRLSGYNNFALGGAKVVWIDDDRPHDSLRGSFDRFEPSIQAEATLLTPRGSLKSKLRFSAWASKKIATITRMIADGILTAGYLPGSLASPA
jgi:hypothetical protein